MELSRLSSRSVSWTASYRREGLPHPSGSGRDQRGTGARTSPKPTRLDDADMMSVDHASVGTRAGAAAVVLWSTVPGRGQVVISRTRVVASVGNRSWTGEKRPLGRSDERQ
jgi:hypothetical protein